MKRTARSGTRLDVERCLQLRNKDIGAACNQVALSLLQFTSCSPLLMNRVCFWADLFSLAAVCSSNCESAL